MEKILLHACCGPCAEYPIQSLVESGFDILLFYHNPNIHPEKEWNRRLSQLEILAELRGITLQTDGESQPEKWMKWNNIDQTERCRMCYTLRLEKTAAKAAELGLKYFASTLQVSIYQNFNLICQLGHAAAKKYGVQFIDSDFRSGYRAGQDMARQDGLYRQKYCGCQISLNESKYRDRVLQELSDLD